MRGGLSLVCRFSTLKSGKIVNFQKRRRRERALRTTLMPDDCVRVMENMKPSRGFQWMSHGPARSYGGDTGGMGIGGHKKLSEYTFQKTE